MKMQVQRVNVVAFTRKIMENFDSVAEEHHIDFLFETEKPELYLWVDVDKYERLFQLALQCFQVYSEWKMIKVLSMRTKKPFLLACRTRVSVLPRIRRNLFCPF